MDNCKNNCSACEIKVKLDAYEQSGLTPEELSKNIEDCLLTEIEAGIQPLISEISTLTRRLKAKDNKINNLLDTIDKLHTEIHRICTSRSELERDEPKLPLYKAKDGITLWYCPVCHNLVSDWNNYCMSCGQRLGERKYDSELKYKE